MADPKNMAATCMRLYRSKNYGKMHAWVKHFPLHARKFRKDMCGGFYVSAFRDRGVPQADEWVPRAPAQMGRARGRARRGERSEAAGDRHERGGNPAAFVFAPRPGRVRLQ
jgi:hypothetical protein